MPVEFLSDEQAARYGRYHAGPSPEQLARFFYLSPADIAFLAAYRLAHTRLGCAVQRCMLRFLGTFLSAPTQVPAVVVHTLATQLQVRRSATGTPATRGPIQFTTTRRSWWPNGSLRAGRPLG